MPKLLKRWRYMRAGEIRRKGDQYVGSMNRRVWHPIVQMLGQPVSYGGEKDRAYRTRRPLPGFYKK